MGSARRQLGMMIAAAVAVSCAEGVERATPQPAAAAAQDGGPRATLGAIAGVVSVKRVDGDGWIGAVEGMELFENDKVRTARGASAQLRFASGSTLVVSEDALVGIAEERPRPGGDPSDVTVLKGRIDAELPDPEVQSLTVTTPAATVRAGREIVFQ